MTEAPSPTTNPFAPPSKNPGRLRIWYDSARTWIREHDAWLTAGAFVGGFVIDLFTLNRIDELIDNLILLSYLFIAGGGILLTHWFWTRESISARYKFYGTVTPLIVQFAFGGLLSGLVIFYTKSASLLASWPFMLVLYIFFVFNDRLRSWYRKIEFQVGIFYLSLVAFMILVIPVLLKSISLWVFIFSTVASLIVIEFYLKLLWRIAYATAIRQFTVYVLIATTFAALNFAYFTNIIPPIPLALKDIGVYHSIERSLSGDYLVSKEDYPWYRLDQWFSTDFHLQSGDTAYVFSSIFAPTGLETTIMHAWERYDPVSESWEHKLRNQYKIVGGRDGGFRWWSYIQNPQTGRWRVRLLTEREQEIGRIQFEVVDDEARYKIVSEEI